MKFAIIPILLLATAVSGCVKPPKTAEGFRQMAPKSSFLKVEKFTVNRSYRQVAGDWRRRSDACLRVRVTTKSSGYRQGPMTFKQDYLPTVVNGKGRAELHIQQHVEGTNLIKVYKEPTGGNFLLIADAYPAGRNKTRIELFRPTMGYDVLAKAVRGWATGKNLGCPDLTKS